MTEAVYLNIGLSNLKGHAQGFHETPDVTWNLCTGASIAEKPRTWSISITIVSIASFTVCELLNCLANKINSFSGLRQIQIRVWTTCFPASWRQLHKNPNISLIKAYPVSTSRDRLHPVNMSRDRLNYIILPSCWSIYNI